MINTLENSLLKIEINTQGAELSSIITKSDAMEYLWQGDPNVMEKKSTYLISYCWGS